MQRPWVLFLCQPRGEYIVCSTLPMCTRIHGSISRSGHISGWLISCIQLPKQLTHWCSSRSPLVWTLRLSYDSVGAEVSEFDVVPQPLFLDLFVVWDGTKKKCRACNRKEDVETRVILQWSILNAMIYMKFYWCSGSTEIAGGATVIGQHLIYLAYHPSKLFWFNWMSIYSVPWPMPVVSILGWFNRRTKLSFFAFRVYLSSSLLFKSILWFVGYVPKSAKVLFL